MLIVIISASIFAASFAKPFIFEQTVGAQNNSLRHWETAVIRGTNLPESVHGSINMRGEEGWELVTVLQTKDGNFVAFLKRRK
jgi:hypothetical protein